MKLLILICLLVATVAVPASTARAAGAGINPAVWNFALESPAGDASWTSATNVVTGWPQYDYSWALSYADAQVGGGWYDVLGYIPESDKSGSGTEYALPFVVLDINLGEPGIFTAHVLAGVDAGGYGYANITDVTLGQVGGYDVTGFRCGGTATVTAVPEPATMAILGLGGLLIGRNRKFNKK
ncbi:MAG: PEP-CTERM sorting domain-containing protein [Phycisphaerae bacterium]|nr:PEP-CTERM sorting domain-containing protein [Phycisphaerae bacterium]MDD5380669.1 PEP-CTERM sorting domain-containing protein [Phycisphaerae bacterium]